MGKKTLVGFKTIKWVCYGCHQHYCTLPIMSGLDKGDECPRCGSTSFNTFSGRVVGKKHKRFSYWLELYNSVKDTTPKEFLGAMFRK